MFGKSITLFRLFGFSVKVDASWLLLAVLVAWSLAEGLFPHYLPDRSRGVYWFMGLSGVVGLVASIVIHEFSHSLVARHYGLPIGGITLFMFGGVAEMEEEPPGAKSEFLMAAAGPASSLVLAGVFAGAQSAGAALAWPAALVTVLFYMAYLNVVLAVFNLVPAFPLDGGRMLRATLWGMGKNLRRATRVAAALGQALGLALIVLGVFTLVSGYAVSGLWWMLIGLFIRAAAENSYGQLRLRESVQGIPVSRFMSAHPVTVVPTLTLRAFYEDYVFRTHHRLFPVEEDGRLVGCIYAKAGRDVERAHWETRRVGDLMELCTARNSVEQEDDAVRALNLMMRTGNTRLVVRSGERAVGVITFRDLAAAARLRDEA